MFSISLNPFAELGNEMASVFTTISSSAFSANACLIKNGRLPSLARIYVLTASQGVDMLATVADPQGYANEPRRGCERAAMSGLFHARRHLLQPPSGLFVGRKERFQRQLRQRDIDRR